MTDIKVYLETELNSEIAVPIAKLATLSFQKSGNSVEKRIEEMLGAAGSTNPQNTTGRRFVIWLDDKAIAHARTFIRNVIIDNQTIPVLALSGVCSDPEFRGQGLGVAVTRKAFEQIDRDGWPAVSLFQTPVADFYKKLGCRVVNNRFVNRLSADDPDANPWRDDTIMIYPESFDWPEGVVDLNGPDY